MKIEFKKLVPLMILILLIIATGYTVTWAMKGRSHTSEYEYQVTIESTFDLHDVLLLVPLPAEFSEEDMEYPESWDVVFYEKISYHENMLHIRIPHLAANTEGSLNISVDWIGEIDTADPWEKEPMLVDSKEEVTEVEPDLYGYTMEVSAIYQAEERSKVNINIELIGRNRWWIFRWTGNEYRDILTVEIYGDGEGIYEGDGYVSTGKRYS